MDDDKSKVMTEEDILAKRLENEKDGGNLQRSLAQQ